MTAATIKNLLADQTVTVADARAAFAALGLSKAEAYELSREMGYTPMGTKRAVLARLQSNVEGLVMNRERVREILNA